MKNLYFQTEEVKQEQPIVKDTQELKTYDEKTYSSEEVPNAPKAEPEKSFTSIIIPAFFNSYPIFHMTGNCIGSIREHTDKEKTPYEIILVMNGNTGIGFSNYEETNCDKVIPVETNEGFTKAVNRGIRVAKGEYICILNNDTQVFNHWLEDLQECLNFKDLVMATPMYGKPYARAVEANELREKSLQKPLQESFTDFRDFSCVLTRKNLFDELGLLDEQFFNHCSDLDLLRRMDEKGKTYASTGDPDHGARINIHHIIEATASGMSENPEQMNKDKELFNQKYNK